MSQSLDIDRSPETTGLTWHKEPLDWMLAKRLSRLIRAADRVECAVGGMSPYNSMLYAIEHGPCWAVMENESRVPIGAFGWTHEGAIWSYWQELADPQVLELMRRTPEYVRGMVQQAQDAGLPNLANYVWEDNRAALTWLRASHCFDIYLDSPVILDNKRFVPFRTKPLEALLHV